VFASLAAKLTSPALGWSFFVETIEPVPPEAPGSRRKAPKTKWVQNLLEPAGFKHWVARSSDDLPEYDELAIGGDVGADQLLTYLGLWTLLRDVEPLIFDVLDKLVTDAPELFSISVFVPSSRADTATKTNPIGIDSVLARAAAVTWLREDWGSETSGVCVMIRVDNGEKSGKKVRGAA
jgi:hypothetical protein